MRPFFSLVLLVVLLVAGPPARARQSAPPDQAASGSLPSAARPDMSRRVVRIFDFEEAHTNPLPVPLHWFRIQDNPDSGQAPAGFSTFNRAELDFHTAYRGHGSVRLPTVGGSTRLRLAPGVLPVFANADYLVSARVFTRGLSHARAYLVARFLDQSGAPVPGSELRSDPVASAGHWQSVNILLPGDHDAAAFIQIDLDLLQPAQTMPPGRAIHQVRAEDAAGDAWFDDVAVIQLPRIELSTTAQGNTIARPDSPELTIFVRDLTGEPLRGRIIVQDAAGREAARWESVISAGRMSARWSPPLDRLGWYRATLEVVTGDRRVGAAYVDFVWLAPPAPAGAPVSPDRARFGLVLQTLEPDQRDIVPELVRRAGGGAITLPVWSAALTAADADAHVARLKPVVDALLAQWQVLTFSLDTVPAEFIERFPAAAGDPLAVLANPEDAWSPILYPLLDKYGQSVRRWQLGHLGDELTFRDRSLSARLDRADRVISRLVPGPRFVVPWRADRALTRDALGPRRDDLDIFLPYAMPPEAVAAYAAALRDDLAAAGGPRRAGIVLETLPAGQFGAAHAAADLVKRAVEFWSILGADESADEPADAPAPVRGSARLAILQPWDSVGQRRAQLMPRAELAVWRNLVDRLSDRRIRGRFPLAPGVTAYLLAPLDTAAEGRSGALVAWRESAAPADSRLGLFLGAGAISAVDIFGNERAVPLGAATIDAAGVPVSPIHTLDIGDEPVFIEGVDAELLNFLTGIHLEPAFLSSDALQHECELVLTNPWTIGASGRVYIVQPGGFTEAGTLDKRWTLTPRTQDFTIAAGQTIRLPISIAFSPSQEAGPQQLILDLDVAAAREYSRVRFATPFEVGLDEMRLDLGYRLEGDPQSPAVVVEARITNRSGQPMTLEVTGFAPGYPRQAASVGRLPPGEHAVRQFVFPGGLTRLRAQPVSITVENIETRARLNKFVTVE